MAATCSRAPALVVAAMGRSYDILCEQQVRCFTLKRPLADQNLRIILLLAAPICRVNDPMATGCRPRHRRYRCPCPIP